MFTLTRESSLAPVELWARVAALAEHTDTVPLTTTISDPGDPGVGWGFTVRTVLGPIRFDDTMVVDDWDPPSHWRIHKTGRSAGLGTGPRHCVCRRLPTHVDRGALAGSGVLRRLTTRVGDLTGPSVFGPVVDRLVAVQA